MADKEPLISVIVPVYNGQDYLENCIRSIASQTYGNREIIIVNDGSTDRTGELCHALREKYGGVSILTLDDRGVSAARNAGVRAAQGELVTFVDADDRLHPAMLRTLYRCMQDAASDVAGCRFFAWRTEAEWQQGVSAADGAERTVIYDPARYLREELLQGNSRCWSKLYRRELFDRVAFDEGLTIGEDMLLLVRMLPHVTRIAETDYRGYGYYQNPSGAMNRKFVPRYMDQLTCWELAREEIRKLDGSLEHRVNTLYLMGIMLTAGKLAALPHRGRKDNNSYVRICHDRLRVAMRDTEAVRGLSAGYRFKTALFRMCPSLYLYLYHILSAAKNGG